MEQGSYTKIRSAVFAVAYVFFIFVSWYYLSAFLVDKELIRSIVSGYGIFSPLVFIFIQIIQNVVAPIAHYPILLAGGFIFGPFLGFLYNWIGTSIGTIIVILLAKKFGRPLISRMISKKFIDKYDVVVQKISPFGLFLIYALPVFPDDEISYLVGVSSMPMRSIIAAIVIGKIPGASLSFTGDTIKGISLTILVQIAVLIIGSAIYFRKDIFRGKA